MLLSRLEAAIGIEPMNKGFADVFYQGQAVPFPLLTHYV